VADSRDPKDEWRKATSAQNAKDEADLVKRLHDKIDLINRTLAEIKDLQSRIHRQVRLLAQELVPGQARGRAERTSLLRAAHGQVTGG